MSKSARTFTCFQCRIELHQRSSKRLYHVSSKLLSSNSIAPKLSIDIKHIRSNEALHKQNCIERNYRPQAVYPARINELHEKWQKYQDEAQDPRERNNKIQGQIKHPQKNALRYGNSAEITSLNQMSQSELMAEARELKNMLSSIEKKQAPLLSEIESLAAAIPNLTSAETPRGTKPKLIGFINEPPDTDSTVLSGVRRSHVEIGQELELLDFASASTTTGWGWYYLINEAAQLEQALVQYALSVARKEGWDTVSPPSLVYSHIAAACGFQPRDQHGEQQVYSIQQNAKDAGVKPELTLAATAEIPLAAMKANTTMKEADLPLKRVGVSRCYRAEAGARGLDTKGLYRVHEFTKVEMFAWTLPSDEASTAVFEEMCRIQTQILTSLGLHCRILEMPSTDLGASATRKRDIEAFFPSRRKKDDGYGEVTSVSTCTDYQTRRLATKVAIKSDAGKFSFPYTVNGTALAVPRIIAAILENNWDEFSREVAIPECLWPYMDGVKYIKHKYSKEKSEDPWK
jgi:seryl-tRNA synthetase